MRKFSLVQPSSLEEAVCLLQEYREEAEVIAGGTDLLGQIKNRIRAILPNWLVNLKNIPQLAYIREDEEGLKIGALTKLKDVASHPVVIEKYSALARAAQVVASPQIRNMGTIGGNVCQGLRCWYYRAPGNYFPCLRKRGSPSKAICYAVGGDHRYHSVFGAVRRCLAVNPSDIAPVLVALNARMKTSKRTIEAENFFTVETERTTVLEPDEILSELQIPSLTEGTKTIFEKYALRKAIDFPLVNCAASITFEKGLIKDVRICLNAVYNLPYRTKGAEDFLRGQYLDESSAEEASQRALESARPLQGNRYLVPIAKWLIKQALLKARN